MPEDIIYAQPMQEMDLYSDWNLIVASDAIWVHEAQGYFRWIIGFCPVDNESL